MGQRNFEEIIPKDFQIYERYEPVDSKGTMKSKQNKQICYSEIADNLK